jgi:hypothetical protein
MLGDTAKALKRGIGAGPRLEPRADGGRRALECREVLVMQTAAALLAWARAVDATKLNIEASAVGKKNFLRDLFLVELVLDCRNKHPFPGRSWPGPALSTRASASGTPPSSSPWPQPR